MTAHILTKAPFILGRGKAAEPLARFDFWDINKDGHIGIEEV